MVRSHEEALSEDAVGLVIPQVLEPAEQRSCPLGGEERLDQEVRALLAKSRSWSMAKSCWKEGWSPKNLRESRISQES